MENIATFFSIPSFFEQKANVSGRQPLELRRENGRMLKDRNLAEPESEQVDPDVRANVDAMIRIGAGMLAYENEKTFHQDEKMPKLKQKYMARGMDEETANSKARRETGKEIKEKKLYTMNMNILQILVLLIEKQLEK